MLYIGSTPLATKAASEALNLFLSVLVLVVFLAGPVEAFLQKSSGRRLFKKSRYLSYHGGNAIRGQSGNP